MGVFCFSSGFCAFRFRSINLGTIILPSLFFFQKATGIFTKPFDSSVDVLRKTKKAHTLPTNEKNEKSWKY